ncbi:type III-B CRISPR module-associated Cmr3 family protein [Anaerostipes sp.]|uniref:type III-B CRISPR module-associated Cmr3 family protein n=1 Tax=Anaerostipes sp. TaxID=1872530 RepID=UPI0025BA883A|nr:type III-B CRISPR module-associated Cmr3 family protein [Anaerostipes sp.]MBS7007939.1 hypothetical protein [Anaerostipes sp.]
MATYRVLFKPLEPYFLGNERSFGFDTGNIRYYAESKEVPSQSTILGTLRYLGLKHIKSDFDYSVEEKRANEKAVGRRSFSIENPPEEYGSIKGISPIFIYNQCKNDERKASIYMPMPKNHKNGEEFYSPWELSESFYETEEGEMRIPVFDVKKGVTDDFIDVESGRRISRDMIFGTDSRVGIKKTESGTKVGTDNSGFFKKDYKYLKQTKMNDYSFGVFVKTEEDIWKEDESRLAYIGQGKSLFQVHFQMISDSYENVLEHLQMKKIFKKGNVDLDHLIYFLSDSYVSNYKEKFKDLQNFSVIETVEYRGLSTNTDKMLSYNKRFKKDEALFRMISAGSIIYTDHKKDLFKMIRQSNLQAAGYNYCL